MEYRQMTCGSWMIHRLWILGVWAAFLITMPCCTPANNSAPISNSYGSQSKNSGLPTPSPIGTFPAVPEILPKPPILGGATNSVIVLPPEISEPQIRVLIVSEQTAVPHVNADLYRGKVLIDRLDDGKFIAINVLPIEDYLAGVLSRELYGDWRPAAYSAQAIAARTYALYQIATFGRNNAWDVFGTLTSQVYGGKNAETTRAWHAVTATRGLVLYISQYGVTGIFCAYYSSSDGGASQSASDAWGDHPLNALQAQSTGTLDAASPEFSWPPITITKAEITQVVDWWGLKNKLPYLTELGPIASVNISQKNPLTGRPQIITLIDIYGHVGKMRAEEFRLAILMYPLHNAPVPPSSFFDVQDEGSSIELINGRGHGHGVGMSQWGAEEMAVRGMSDQEILSFYYPDSWIHKQW